MMSLKMVDKILRNLGVLKQSGISTGLCPLAQFFWEPAVILGIGHWTHMTLTLNAAQLI